jgi:acetoin utilization deacetylase AcuC-like enzyme
MDIIYSDKHIMHNVGGRSSRREGEVHISYWEGQKIRLVPEPGDYQEIPARMSSILNAVAKTRLGPILPPNDFGTSPVLAVHDPDFVEYLQTIYQKNAELTGFAGPVFPESYAVRHTGQKPAGIPGLKGYYTFDIFTSIVEGTWNAAYWSAQCALTGADLIRKGSKIVYAACRPSGHHASRDLFGGFCFLNNAAIAARQLQQSGQAKVAILDIDFHHGNGTQSIFYSDPDVLFCSLHGDPEFAFPYYTGTVKEIGEGAGEGFNHNWPLPRGTGDALYLKTLEAAVQTIHNYHPAYLVVSAGFDICAGDPYGLFNISLDGVHAIGVHIAGLSKHIPTLVVQEGGYVPEELGKYVAAFLDAFS